MTCVLTIWTFFWKEFYQKLVASSKTPGHDNQIHRIGIERAENLTKENANIKVLTEKDFQPGLLTKDQQQCLLEVPLTTYGIENISMEYCWSSMKGDILIYNANVIPL